MIKKLFFFFLMCPVLFAASQSWAESCSNAGCHKNIAEIKNKHEPVKKEECQACHQQCSTGHPVFGEKNFLLTAKGAALCSQCHDRKEKKKVVHPPDCLFACHKPHGADGRFLLDNDKDLTPLSQNHPVQTKVHAWTCSCRFLCRMPRSPPIIRRRTAERAGKVSVSEMPSGLRQVPGKRPVRASAGQGRFMYLLS